MTPTPSEKAKELVEKFTPCTKDFYEDKGWVGNIERAKEAAIILCDEVIDLLECFSESEQTIEYYQSVRSEIEKL